ncbi:hypothetical protein WR25_20017 [Diploscapter pachys]|uniref:CC domain-containing protein n=1 Tax=Diploscapter pachys TaxID=2018661 RepID=A0A2A2JTS9_9BILA|nr:hypothetical protein WR25_20017 [Diploscapter pachys]
MQSMIILALCLVVAVSAQNYGCSVPQGPCMALNGMNICPSNQGCVDNNSVCCNYGDIINKDQPTTAPAPTPAPNCFDKLNPNTGVSGEF